MPEGLAKFISKMDSPLGGFPAGVIVRVTKVLVSGLSVFKLGKLWFEFSEFLLRPFILIVRVAVLLNFSVLLPRCFRVYLSPRFLE